MLTLPRWPSTIAAQRHGAVGSLEHYLEPGLPGTGISRFDGLLRDSDDVQLRYRQQQVGRRALDNGEEVAYKSLQPDRVVVDYFHKAASLFRREIVVEQELGIGDD